MVDSMLAETPENLPGRFMHIFIKNKNGFSDGCYFIMSEDLSKPVMGEAL